MSETDNKSDELAIRLSVTETKVTNIESDVYEQKKMLKEISSKVEIVSNHFAKMNGSIPHIEEACGRIEKHLEHVAATNIEQEAKITRNSLYVKLLWTLTVPLALAIAGGVIKIFMIGITSP